ncbi:crossover junction endodeoxyribonuclease RuvC [Magnetococcales bacterium HHB-1]
MRVLGIDPGSNVTGWGIMDEVGRGVRHVAHGCVRLPPKTPLPERLTTIHQKLSGIIAQYQPAAASVEEVFVSRNVQSALKLGHARGVAVAAIGAQGIPIFEYTALKVKKAVVGYGRAEKQQVQEMIKLLLDLPKVPPQDAADALANALCHIQSRERFVPKVNLSTKKRQGIRFPGQPAGAPGWSGRREALS